MNVKLPHILAAAILFTSVSTAAGDQKSHRKAAEALLEVMGVEDQLQARMDQMLDLQVKMNAQLAPVKDTMKRF